MYLIGKDWWEGTESVNMVKIHYVSGIYPLRTLTLAGESAVTPPSHILHSSTSPPAAGEVANGLDRRGLPET